MEPLDFIIEKIEETKAAIFYPVCSGPLIMPNYVIKTYKADKDGNIWFFINRPAQLISQFEQEFPVELIYYKKGSNYSLKIWGKAKMLIDPEELEQSIPLSPEQLSGALTWQILVKVKIINAEYIDYNQKDFFHSFKKLKPFLIAALHKTKQLMWQPAAIYNHISTNFFTGIFKK